MTLLADLVLETLAMPKARLMPSWSYQDSISMKQVARAVERAPKCRVMPQVFQIAMEVYGSVRLNKQDAPCCQHPGHSWLEWAQEGYRVGVLFGQWGDEDGKWGGIVFTRIPNLDQWGTHYFEWRDGNLEALVPLKRPPILGKPINKEDIPESELGQVESLGTVLTIAQIILSMMDNPRLVEKQPKIIDTALQRSRAKRGVRPLSDHAEVVIHVTRKEREAWELAEGAIRKGRILHYVRPFHRLKRGKVERVREHWRGDAGLGVKPKPGRYRVSL